MLYSLGIYWFEPSRFILQHLSTTVCFIFLLTARVFSSVLNCVWWLWHCCFKIMSSFLIAVAWLLVKYY